MLQQADTRKHPNLHQHARSSTHSWNWTPEHGTRKQDTGCSAKDRTIGTCSITVRTIPDRWTGTLPTPNKLTQHKIHSLSTPPQPHQDMYARSTTKRKSSQNRHSQQLKLQLEQNNQPTQLQNDFNLTKQTKILTGHTNRRGKKKTIYTNTNSAKTELGRTGQVRKEITKLGKLSL